MDRYNDYLYANKRPVYCIGRNFLSLSAEEMQEKYEKDFEYVSRLQDEMYYGKDLLPELEEYIKEIIHECNLHAGTTISTIKNLEWYKKEKPEKIADAEQALWRFYLKFIRYIQHIEILYYGVFLGAKDQ